MFQIVKTSSSRELDFEGAFTTVGNGVKRVFVKVNEEMFVNAVKKRPILYNTTLKDHKRFSHRHDAWAEVAVEMNLSEQECKKRWRSLRDAFMKVVRNRNEDERKSWIHYRLLEFLLPYIGKKCKRPIGSSGLQSMEYMEEFGNEEDDEEEEFVMQLEDDMEIYKGGRDQITVSYVTEDGKEVFQMLQDRDTIPEGAVIGIEESDVEDGIEEDDIHEGQHPDQMGVDDMVIPGHDHAKSFFYEERLEPTMMKLRGAYKSHSLSEAEGSEIQVEEIEMDSLISDQLDDDNVSIAEPLNQPIVETISPKIEVLDTELAEPDHTFTSGIVPAAAPVPTPSTSQQTAIGFQISTPPQRTATPQSHVAAPVREEPPTPVVPAIREIQQQQQQPQPESSKSGCADSDERFLLSCAPILRRLPNKKNQLARLKIQQLLFELEYDEKYSS